MGRAWQAWWGTFGARGTAAALFVILVLVVGFQNMEPADIDFLFWDLVEVPKLTMIVGTTLIGFVVGYALAWWGRRPRRGGADYDPY